MLLCPGIHPLEHHHNTENNESHHCDDFNHRKDKFCFVIAPYIEQVDTGNEEQENHDEYDDIDTRIPIADSDSGSSELERKNYQPSHRAIPPHDLCRIDKSSGVLDGE